MDYNGFFQSSWAPNGETIWQEMTLCSPFSFDPSRPRPDESIEPKMRGDVNGNGSVDAADAAMILRYIVRLVGFNSRQIEAAALTSDTVSAADVARILRWIVRLEPEL